MLIIWVKNKRKEISFEDMVLKFKLWTSNKSVEFLSDYDHEAIFKKFISDGEHIFGLNANFNERDLPVISSILSPVITTILKLK